MTPLGPAATRPPANVLVAVVLVAVNEPANALIPKSLAPFTESARHGVVVPSPRFVPVKIRFEDCVRAVALGVAY